MVRASAILGAAATIPASRAIAASATQATWQQRAQDDFETGVELTIPFNPYGQPITLDPHRAPNWGPFWVLFPHLWSGLLAFDENGGVVLDLADSVEPNETADDWTVAIRPGLQFASGNPVNAQAFIDSWKRALNPDQLAPMSTFMERVQGYEEHIQGQSPEIGFTAVDELTIEITLSEPYSSFPASLATFGWAVLDLAAMETIESATPGASGISGVPGIGMWQVTEFVDGDRIVCEPHPGTPTPLSPSISKLIWQVVDGPDAAATTYEMYQSDVVPVADVPSSLLPSVTEDDALAAELIAIEPQASTLAIGMDFSQAPFNDLRYRQAVAASIDREAWATDIQKVEFVPGQAIVPPSVNLTSGYESAVPIEFSAEEAASLLESAGYDPDSGEADVVYYQPATDTLEQQEQAAALLSMIQENAGLVVRHDTSLTADQISSLQNDNGGRQFDILWWWTASDTPSLLETIGTSTSPAMAGVFNWSTEVEGVDDQVPGDASAEFEELILQANATTDDVERNALFREAEQLLLDNAVYVPLGHWVQRYLQKPWLTGTRQGPWSGSIPVRFDDAVLILPRSQ
jgi:oligopeptide transport system substrate-binding protein